MKEEEKQVAQQLNWPGAVVLISGLIFVSGIISKLIEYKEKIWVRVKNQKRNKNAVSSKKTKTL